jgi:hypothetical protein
MTAAIMGAAPQPATARQRLFAVALLVVLLAFGGFATISYWQDVIDAEAQIQARETLAEGLNRGAARITTDASHASGPSEQQNPYLVGETETIAAAQFQTLVLSTVEPTGSTVFSTQVKARPATDTPIETSPATGEVQDRQIDLEMVFEAHIAEMQRILFTLEQGSPCIFVDELQLQPAKTPQSTEAVDPDPLLHVVLTLHSFWRS